jgi:G3E family GTPase
MPTLPSASPSPVETAIVTTRTPLLLVTGFLGSGKTTFINRLLHLPGLPKLGVVVNEFGQIGIDGTLLAGTGILELANGCVCCVKGTEMWESALELVDRAGAEVLLVETSGMVEPAVLLDQYALLPAALAARLDLRGLLCLVDALHVAKALQQRREVEQQLRLSDRLLLTKSDLCQPAELLAVHKLLDELGASSERAGITPTTPGGEVASLLRWGLQTGRRRPPRSGRARPAADAERAQNHAHDHDHDPRHDEAPHGGRQLMAVSVREEQPLLADPLQRLLRELPGQVLRAKGLVRLLAADAHGQPVQQLFVLQVAGQRAELAPASAATAAAAAPGSTLVFIGEDLDESWLRLRLSACRSGGAGA